MRYREVAGSSEGDFSELKNTPRKIYGKLNVLDKSKADNLDEITPPPEWLDIITCTKISLDDSFDWCEAVERESQ